MEGAVECRVALSRERGQPVAEVRVSARIPLRCQRCMQPVWIPVEADSKVWLVTDPARADDLDPGIEPTLAPEGRVVLRDLVEEEILLAVPLVPRHERSPTVVPATPLSVRNRRSQRTTRSRRLRGWASS